MVQLQTLSSDEIPTTSNPPNSVVRILLLGDPGAGKTSLIYSLTNDNFSDDKLPARLADVNIPADVSPDDLSITIIDYSQRDPSQESLTGAIQKATVICIVYTSGSHDSLDRVAKYWIPTVRNACDACGEHKPMILVANKVDVRANINLQDKLNHIRQKFIDVENFIEVSAINHSNVIELISSAQKAVTYPLAPLFDPRTRTLTSKCRIALTEIFKLCDHDGDALMSDHEINMFQESCFGTPLKQDALEDLKNIIRQSTVDGITNNSLTLDGFLFLHALSIDKGRQDFTWQVLRKHNYDNQLNLGLGDPTIADRPSLEASASTSKGENSISGLVEDTKNYLRLDPRSRICGRELISQLDIAPWLRDNPRMVKTGLGITVTTFISFMALKFIIQGVSRG